MSKTRLNAPSAPAGVAPHPATRSLTPDRFARRVLLAVTGEATAVVTETLYALMTRTDQPFVPTEVRVLTTARGARAARRDLAGPQGQVARLYAELGHQPLQGDGPEIHVLRADSAPDAPELEDLRTLPENERCGDWLCGEVLRLCQDPACALHVSIAGGRKTMGFYLGYALTLFGRSQDRLSHVLVEEPFENNRSFFYPSRTQGLIPMRPGSSDWVDPAQARVHLAEIPFVRLSLAMGKPFAQGEISLHAAVAAMERNLRPRLSIEVRSSGESRIYIDKGDGCGLVELTAKPQCLTLFAWLLYRRKRGLGPVVNANAAKKLRITERNEAKRRISVANTSEWLLFVDYFARGLCNIGLEKDTKLNEGRAVINSNRFNENLSRLKGHLHDTLPHDIFACLYPQGTKIGSGPLRRMTGYAISGIDPDDIQLKSTGELHKLESAFDRIERPDVTGLI